ncbi:MAG: efflux transporter periplasmic adaptor subunit, partial [Nitrospirota bacterium]|nr:efflux transporter periplasmic adaptor subunit [Nitrospirota bacterium]
MKKHTIAAIALVAGLVIGGAVIRFTSSATHEKTAAQSAGPEKKERRILYYRNPMNPKVTSPVFMKDSMGMDYIPVYEDDKGSAPAPGLVRI